MDTIPETAELKEGEDEDMFLYDELIRSSITKYSADKSTSSRKKNIYISFSLGDAENKWSKSSRSDGGFQTKCSLCCLFFPSPIVLQVHLQTQKHPPLECIRTIEYQNDPKYRCTVCVKELNFSDALVHQCLQDRVKKFHLFLSEQKKKYASPFICVYCNLRKFKNRFALAIHIIMQHTRNAGKSAECPICRCVFKTTSTNMMEMHGLQEHLPEMMMMFRQMKAGEVKTSINLSAPFICLYPHKKYDPTPNESSLLQGSVMRQKFCEKEFSGVAQFTAHFIAMHGSLNVTKKCQKKFKIFCTYCRPLHGSRDLTSLSHHIRDKHELSAENRAILATKDMFLNERYNADVACFLCWSVFSSNVHLQAHIICSHLTLQWRACDTCGRKYCDLDENVSDKITCLLIDKHEKRHCAILEEHMDLLNRATFLPDKVPLVAPKPVFFAEIQILDWKKLLAAKAKPVLSQKILQHFRKLRDKNEEAQTELLFLDMI